ncbi:serine/threonine protein kinase US3 [Beluga whale alphaherpesvirus 1]|uniref:Serine/threonine protein kinase US3 n=1 Tax=Beluga whale alphaherpesvirus 1 TaxID=1434720 RepID=A0A286MM83_9ALPH|nr:serine/threonine protein kinase US3 [Beluga whale alphaherpesvirus 1]ASW27109.1 serine/threonine protein kinase US3 [Beluga whale alphaherpesvirus 1]
MNFFAAMATTFPVSAPPWKSPFACCVAAAPDADAREAAPSVGLVSAEASSAPEGDASYTPPNVLDYIITDAAPDDDAAANRAEPDAGREANRDADADADAVEEAIHGVTKSAALAAAGSLRATILTTLQPGSEGHVFVALHPLLRRQVVLKIGPADLALFEATLLKKLRHPNVIELLDVHTHARCLCMIFPRYVGDLYTLLSTNDRPFSERDAVSIIRAVLEGLRYVHGRRIIHRDVKTENILINDPTHVCISDFGAACEAGRTPKHHGLAGTMETNAPEILARAAYDAKVDVWSTGLVFFELVAYPRVLFDGDEDSAPETRQGCRAQLRRIIEALEVHPLEFPREEACRLNMFRAHATATRPPFSRYPCISALSLPVDVEHCLHKMLTFSFRARPTAAELLTHPLFAHSPAETV